MIIRYALPSDDLAGSATVTVLGGSPSDEDPEYPASNLVAPTNSGHLNLPSRPAKLTTTSGTWELTFGSPITFSAAALIYHNFDAGLNVTLEADSGSPGLSEAFTIPTHWEDDWVASPWIEFDPVTASVVRLAVNSANSLPCQVGRLMLLGELRTASTDVRWGEVEEEIHGLIEQPTELGIETIFALGGKRRSFTGEQRLYDSEASDLITLWRSAHGRVLPWLLIPDEDVNDAWLVRFEDLGWARTRVVPNANDFPFRVRELSRGLPWP